MTKLKLFSMLGPAVIALGVSTCGGVTDSRESARDKATKATCDRYQSCGLIGPNADDTYVTFDSCMTIWKGTWEGWWPVATCTAINQSGLNVCLNAIGATDCTSPGDFILTLTKCQEVDVCLPPPSTADGG